MAIFHGFAPKLHMGKDRGRNLDGLFGDRRLCVCGGSIINSPHRLKQLLLTLCCFYRAESDMKFKKN